MFVTSMIRVTRSNKMLDQMQARLARGSMGLFWLFYTYFCISHKNMYDIKCFYQYLSQANNDVYTGKKVFKRPRNAYYLQDVRGGHSNGTFLSDRRHSGPVVPADAGFGTDRVRPVCYTRFAVNDQTERLTSYKPDEPAAVWSCLIFCTNML